MSFFAALFDWRFQRFATPKLVEFLFVAAVALGAVFVVSADIITLANLAKFDALPGQRRADEGWEIWLVIASPVLYMLGVVFLRVLLETVVVLFRIAEALSSTHRP